MEQLLAMSEEDLGRLTSLRSSIDSILDLNRITYRGVIAELLRVTLDRSKHSQELSERVQRRLLGDPNALKALIYMESTDGLPKVIHHDGEGFILGDGTCEIPFARRYLAYDEDAEDWWNNRFKAWWEYRQAKNHDKGLPEEGEMICLGSAISGQTQALGLELTDYSKYLKFFDHDAFDRRSATWLKTPEYILEKGEAQFAMRSMTGQQFKHNTSMALGARYIRPVSWDA